MKGMIITQGNILSYTLTLLFTISVLLTKASIIIPHKNYGEMAKNSTVVVLAKANYNYEREVEGNQYFETSFTVDRVIKGAITDVFSVRNYRKIINGYRTEIDGDVTFTEGQTYLLLLEPVRLGAWQTKMLSYGILEEKRIDDKVIMAPVPESLDIALWTKEEEEWEKVQAYEKSGLLQTLDRVLKHEGAWDANKISVQYEVERAPKISLRAAPSYCDYIGDSRWRDLDNDELPIYSHTSGDPLKTSVHTIVRNAINDISDSYDNIIIDYAGTHSFAPSASETTAIGDDFVAYARTVNSGRVIIIQYDDPTDEISDLDDCVGTLAYGGTYHTVSNTHSYNGEDWKQSSYGFVVVNDSTGACLSNTNYKLMMTHELTHALNIGHISDTYRANMNPYCCESISSYDQNCMNYSYSAESLPLDLLAFDGHKENEQISLEWETTNEINHAYFELEFSIDGYQFEVIGRILAQSNDLVTKQYQFQHQNPQVGQNYYRLKQVSVDGSYQYSPVRSIVWDEKQSEFSIFPNPVSQDIHIRYSKKIPIEYLLYSVEGRLIRKGTVENSTINVEGMQKGIYFLTLDHEGKRHIERIAIL